MTSVRILLLFGLVLPWSFGYGQIDDFPRIGKQDILNDSYELAPDAPAIALLEKGKTQIQKSESDMALMVFHQYQSRTKIRTKEGYQHANYLIPLYTYGSKKEYIINIQAYTHYIDQDGNLISIKLKNSEIFTEKVNEYVQLTKFTMPNISPGAVIDVTYTIVSPDLFNFRTWTFQSDIPKIHSECNAIMPGIFNYNVTLRGALKITDTKSRLVRECLLLNGIKADCSDITYIMKDIPAFEEEDYMLAPKNYLSAIHFELEEAMGPSGSKTKYTKSWSDVDRELMTDRNFGGQLKKLDFFKKLLPDTIKNISNTLDKAKEVYAYVQRNIHWNKMLGKYSQKGIEDAFEQHQGNVADINLALTAALNAVNIEAYPILVSTRDNGLPNNLHPVISGFNYVICGFKIDGQLMLADATERYLPLGDIPLRCVNEKGRIIYSRKSSEWTPLTNPSIASTRYTFSGMLNLDGTLSGKLAISYTGLDALRKRQDIARYPTLMEYQENIDQRLNTIKLNSLTLENQENTAVHLVELLDVVVTVSDTIAEGKFSFNPIFIDRTTRNPFNLDERSYHVDLGARRNESHQISIQLPPGVTLLDSPKNINIRFPDDLATYRYISQCENDTLQISQTLLMNSAIYSPEEYFGLKDIFSKMIQHLKIDFTFAYQQ